MYAGVGIDVGFDTQLAKVVSYLFSRSSKTVLLVYGSVESSIESTRHLKHCAGGEKRAAVE